MANEGADDKPFECSICKKKFSKHDTMSVHYQKHSMDLDLLNVTYNKSNLQFSDQTPTPTSIIKHGEEIGLFNDIKAVETVESNEPNPFDIAFRQGFVENVSKNIHSIISEEKNGQQLEISTSALETPIVSMAKKNRLQNENSVIILDDNDNDNNNINAILSTPNSENNNDKLTDSNLLISKQSIQPLTVQLTFQLSSGTVLPLQIPAQLGRLPASTNCNNNNNNGSGGVAIISPASSDSKSYLTKQKLKNVIRSGNSAASTPTEDHSLKTSLYSNNKIQPIKRAADTSTTTISQEGGTDDKQPDEKKMKTLERNRMAAARSRQKKKSQIDEMLRRYDQTKRSLTDAERKIRQLEAENMNLKRMFLQHKDCPLFRDVKIITTTMDNAPTTAMNIKKNNVYVISKVSNVS